MRSPNCRRPVISARLLEPLPARVLLSAGDLDPLFGGGGKVTTAFQPGNGAAIDYSGSASTNPNYGKIVVVGGYGNGPDFLLARYNSNGTLDITFGPGGADGDGKLTTDFASGSIDEAEAVAI